MTSTFQGLIRESYTKTTSQKSIRHRHRRVGCVEVEVPDTMGYNLHTSDHLARGKFLVAPPHLYLNPADIELLPKKKIVRNIYNHFKVKRWRHKLHIPIWAEWLL